MIRAWLCAAALACAAGALAQEATPRYRLEVEAPTRELRELLQKGLQLARWQGDAQMTPELLRRLADEAVVEARGALAAQGYFAAKVGAGISRGVTPWVVTLRVDPGERTLVTHVELAFAGPVAKDPEAADLLKSVRRGWLLRAGMPFTQAAWDEAKSDAARRLAAWRYPSARVTASRARVDPKTHSAVLEVTLDSGPPTRFGKVEVRGAKRYPESTVANLSPVQPGATYDREVLELYTRRLMETGYFAGARAEAAVDPLAGGAGTAPVRASVIEGNSQSFEGGISFNTDSRLRLELAHRNADLLDSAWRGRARLRLDELTQEARYDLDSPPRPGATWLSGFASAKHTDIQQEENTDFSLGVSHNWGGRGAPTAVLASAHQEEQRISGNAADHRYALFLGARVGLLDTDQVVMPRQGYFALLTAGGAPSFASTRSFGRLTARGTVLVPLARNDDLQLRAEAGHVVARTREGIPSAFLFRTGGDQTIRGYAFESLGVRQGDAVLGGRNLTWGSIEYTHWFGAWGLAAFSDAGNAWDSGSLDPVLGVGGGLRFRTPIGPVRADLAYGEEQHSWRLHFSVGFVF